MRANLQISWESRLVDGSTSKYSKSRRGRLNLSHQSGPDFWHNQQMSNRTSYAGLTHKSSLAELYDYRIPRRLNNDFQMVPI